MAPSPRPALGFPHPGEPVSSSGLRVKELGLGAPRRAGRYLLLDTIGSGGMATIHLARVDGPGGFQRWCAVKRVHPELAQDAQFVDMFLDEARHAARMNHPNVVHVFEVGRDDESYWLAMEYLHGEPLAEVLRRAAALGVRVPWPIAARIVADAALGLHAAHELRMHDGAPLGLVHRDVSPHNLFVTYEGRTKVVDFGIAKSHERLAQATVAGILKGKIAYMSPEQVTGGLVDRRTDIFALGVILWEMTTGRRLFRADSDFETLTRLMDGAVERPSAIVPGYPPELEACVMAALARRPEHRPATARDLARALERYLASTEYADADDVGHFVRALCADRKLAREARLREIAARDADPCPIEDLEDEDQGAATVVMPCPELELGSTMVLPPDFAVHVNPAPPPPIVASPYRLPPPAPLVVPLPAPKGPPPRRVAVVAAITFLVALAVALWRLG